MGDFCLMILLYKYHGLGNDYLIYDPNKNHTPLTCDMVKYLCHRNYGAGSDGILYGPIINKDNPSEFSLEIYNPDGEQAEKSGNGIRIFAAYLKDFGYVFLDDCIITTLSGQSKCLYIDGNSCHTKVYMGKATTDAKSFPIVDCEGQIMNYNMVSKPLTFNKCLYYVTCVNIGNPHCVIPLVNISKNLAMKLGPYVETSPHFPNKINMQLLKVIDNKNIAIEIYERGAGYTLASGSSSCAAAFCAHTLGLVDNKVTVHMPGGCLEIEIMPDNGLYMSGNVKYIGEFNVVEPSTEQ